MFWLRQYREPTSRLPDHLPWAALVGPGVVLQKDGLLQKTIAFRGPDLASSSDSELLSAVARLNNALKRLGTGWALFIEAQRFDASEYQSSVWKQPAAWIVDLERRRMFEGAGAHFESSYYITFIWRMPSDSKSKFEALFYEDSGRKDARATALRDLQSFEKNVVEVVDIMRGVFPDVAELSNDETLSYLHSTVSTHRHWVRTPCIPMYLDALLPDMAFTRATSRCWATTLFQPAASRGSRGRPSRASSMRSITCRSSTGG